MSGKKIVPVILSGGSGVRLWPLSTPAHPKQFHALVSGKTLFQEAVERSKALPSSAAPIVVCNESHEEFVTTDLSEMGVSPLVVIQEPLGRNTAPAICAAAIVAQREVPEAQLLVLAADHMIENRPAFEAAVAAAVEASQQGYLVTFGVVPDRPETGYGYLRTGAAHGTWTELAQFVEKPDFETAKAYFDSGEFLWNSGMFLMSARLFLAELAEFEPDMLQAVQKALDEAEEHRGNLRLGPSFRDCPANSIDYAVMERTSKAAVVPLDAGWSDVGSWSALRQMCRKNEQGNVLHGDVIASNLRASYVHASSKRIAVAGLDNVVIVETDDTILVMSESESQNVKSLMQESLRRKAEK